MAENIKTILSHSCSDQERHGIWQCILKHPKCNFINTPIYNLLFSPPVEYLCGLDSKI